MGEVVAACGDQQADQEDGNKKNTLSSFHTNSLALENDNASAEV